MNYKKENMINELKNRLDEKEALKEAWEKVERIHTKAGADFKVISKNFKGCTFKPIDYLIQPDREIYVSCRSSKTQKYYTDSIRERVSISPYDKEPDIKPDRIITGSFGSRYYLRNADEIEIEIKQRILYMDKRIKEIKNELEIISGAFDKVTNKMNELKNICIDLPCDIRSMLNDYIKGGYFY